MKPLLFASAFCIYAISDQPAWAQFEPSVTVTTLAGSGLRGTVDGVGGETMFNSIDVACASPSGLLFVLDSLSMVRRIDSNAVVTTVFSDTRKRISNAFDMVCLPTERGIQLAISSYWGLNLVWADKNAGDGSFPYINATQYQALVDGYVTEGARIGAFYAMTYDIETNLVFFDSGRIRKFARGAVTTIAGSGNTGNRDGLGVFTSFGAIFFREDVKISLMAGEDGSLYVGDRGNASIRHVTKSGEVKTLAISTNTPTELKSIIWKVRAPHGAFFGYLANRVFKLSPTGAISLVAGRTESGDRDGVGSSALFRQITDIEQLPDGSLAVIDSGNYKIRKVSFGAESEELPPAAISVELSASITVNGIPGRTYRIEFSENASPPSWQPLTTVTAITSTFTWHDRVVGAKRFYRALLLP